jgi:Acetyltransferase (GNAT) family
LIEKRLKELKTKVGMSIFPLIRKEGDILRVYAFLKEEDHDPREAIGEIYSTIDYNFLSNQTSHSIEIVSIDVDEKYENQGIATLILQEYIRYVILETFPDKDIKFYGETHTVNRKKLQYLYSKNQFKVPSGRFKLSITSENKAAIIEKSWKITTFITTHYERENLKHNKTKERLINEQINKKSNKPFINKLKDLIINKFQKRTYR